MDVLALDEISITVIGMCSIDVLHGLYTGDPDYGRSAVAYFGLDGLYIGIRLRDCTVIRMLCDSHRLNTTDDFQQFLTEYDNKYMFKHDLPMSYIEKRWNDNMDVEKHLVDASVRQNERGIDFILTRERLRKSADHISLVVTTACENTELCGRYMNNVGVNIRCVRAVHKTALIRRGSKVECSRSDFDVVIANERWDLIPEDSTITSLEANERPDLIPQEGTIINVMDCAIAEGNMKLVYNPVVPDHVKPYTDTTSLSREDIIRSVERAMERGNFRMEMLEYFDIQPDELVPNLTHVSGGVIRFSLFCELRDKGYLGSTSSVGYSPYHYLYDIQRGIVPRELGYPGTYNVSYLFILFMKCDDPVVKYNCAKKIFKLMNRCVQRYHPYMIRKICDWNRDFLDDNRWLIEILIGRDVLMEEWYESKC